MVRESITSPCHWSLLATQRHTSTIFVSGTFFQVTNLLNIMDSESAKTDTTEPGLDMRKTLASVIITEKATTDPCMVMNALIRCLQVPEVRTPSPPHISLDQMVLDAWEPTYPSAHLFDNQGHNVRGQEAEMVGKRGTHSSGPVGVRNFMFGRLSVWCGWAHLTLD